MGPREQGTQLYINIFLGIHFNIILASHRTLAGDLFIPVLRSHGIECLKHMLCCDVM